jgi:hypothetical protein
MRGLTLDYSLLVKELDEKTKSIFMPALLGEPELCIGSVGVAVFEVRRTRATRYSAVCTQHELRS